MRKYLAILLIGTTITTVVSNESTPVEPYPYRPDIVIIDTGTTKSYEGFLRMKSSCVSKCWHSHGELITEALIEELSMQGMEREVHAEHLVWETALDIPSLIDRAASLSPKVIIIAISGDEPITEEFLAIKRATDKGISVVAASGNVGGQNSQYPARYNLPCLTSVSTKKYGSKVATANVGEIYLEQMSGEKGTSFSTARAGALVVKLHERFGNIKCNIVKSLLVEEFGSAQ